MYECLWCGSVSLSNLLTFQLINRLLREACVVDVGFVGALLIIYPQLPILQASVAPVAVPRRSPLTMCRSVKLGLLLVHSCLVLFTGLLVISGGAIASPGESKSRIRITFSINPILFLFLNLSF